MNVVIAAAEVAPWSKTGGLGDVCGALPRVIAARGHRVVTVAPRYRAYPDLNETSWRSEIHLFGQNHGVRWYGVERDGVHHLFVDHPSFHRAGIYGDSTGPYGDNLFRFALLSRAAIEAALLPIPGGALGEEVLFHANDWHTALIPLFLDALYRPAGRFTRAATVLGLHNAGHHGSFPASSFPGLDVSSRWWPQLEFDGNLNLLKCGVCTADRLVAVSPTYAREVTGELGFGLGPLFAFRGDALTGVLNGVDAAWDPATDLHLAARYSVDDLAGKAVNKAALQRELGLPVRPEVPLLAVISRLDAQKGIELVAESLEWILAQDVQLVLLGSGSRALEQVLRDAERTWPTRARGWVGFNESLAHRIEAGADIFLMPSRFEPCGLNQMYSMRYGTVPVVHATGGLADTVQTYDPTDDTGTGWAFRSHTGEAFREALWWALVTYRLHPVAWRGIQRRGMLQDFSWEASAARYVSIYEDALRRRGLPVP